MEKSEIEAALARLGLEIPKSECDDIANASKFIEEMIASVRKLSSPLTEPAENA